jgi:hypothetical protein
MKKLITFLTIAPLWVCAQTNDLKPVEPEAQTSFTNQDLILIALASFALLIAIYFLFRRAKKRR